MKYKIIILLIITGIIGFSLPYLFDSEPRLVDRQWGYLNAECIEEHTLRMKMNGEITGTSKWYTYNCRF